MDIIYVLITGDEAHIPFLDIPTYQESKVCVSEDDSKQTMMKRQWAKYCMLFRSTWVVKIIKLGSTKSSYSQLEHH